MNCIHLFPVYPEIFPVFSYDKTSQHSKWMDNLNIDWSSSGILSCFFGCEGKIHKTKPWINQACKEIHTATLGMKLISVVCKLEIRINLIKVKSWTSPLLQIHIQHQICNLALIQNQYATPNVESRPYSKSKYTTKCGIVPLLQIDMHRLPGIEPGAFSM